MASMWTQGRVFALVFTVNLLTNFDSGALPGVLNHLRAQPEPATAAPVSPSPSPPPPPPLPRPRGHSTSRRAPARMQRTHSGRRALELDIATPDPLPPVDSGAGAPECPDCDDGPSLSYFACGVLGSLPYIALSVVSPFVGYFLQHADVKGTLVLAVFWNGVASALFGLAPSTWLLMATRFAVGISQAFAVIYFPVWVDATAPRASKTSALSLLQVGVPLGLVVGYLAGGLLTSYVPGGKRLLGLAAWRWPFLMQGAALVPLGLLFATVPAHMLVVDAEALPLASPSRMRSDDPSHLQERAEARSAAPPGGLGTEDPSASSPRAPLGMGAMLRALLSSPVYVYVLLCLSSIFFIVSGIQYWVTIFLLDHFHMPQGTVVLSFALVSSTGPLLGVLAGGWLVDRVGGYDNHARCLRVLANYTLVGILLAAGIALSESAVVVIILIWCLLVVGGAVLAPATGVLITAVPAHVRTFASAISMMSYNVLGYFLAPLLSGVVIEYYGIHWGFRLVVSWVVFSCAFLFLAVCAADQAQANPGLETNPTIGATGGQSEEGDRANADSSRSPRTDFALVRDHDGSLNVIQKTGSITR
mmetsp:Transcript_19323/g.51997  ORF Transcript_19323/g.51997 Transcript_19323/m.51997 type:complete len:588 (-) Transcript_19323:311-2074(-)